ncbi:MAG: hypothetical protein CVU05_14990 [Bacteroidetes bacterium HGW-Bacteroidetes-21]|nr:MAG: hypothetical protein CVU05_14990 [Bacteroidetes bacterium HGW-Bacteroidetes-21]
MNLIKYFSFVKKMNLMKAKLLLLFVLVTSILTAQNEFSTRRVAVFKNGTGFFIKNAQVNAVGGKFILPFTPDGLFGTFWISAAGERVPTIQTVDEKSVVNKEVTSIYEMLKGNVGKKVKILTFSNETVEATIETVSPMLISMKTKEGWFSTSPDQIKSMHFTEKPESTFAESTGKNKLMLTFANAGNKNIDMMYLQKGISWLPEYLVELLDDKNAVVTLRATLINDAEDLNNAAVSFVVGVPNFKYNNILSPLCSTDALTTFLGSLNGYSTSGGTGRFDNNVMANAMLAQSYNSNNYDEPSPEYTVDVFSAEGTNNEDLFFYDFSGVSLKKGGRASYEILTAKLAYEHIYEVEIARNSDLYFNGKSAYDNTTTANSVWHSIKFTNTTKMPFTTGSAMVVDKENNITSPVSQDMMKYTPMGGESFLKITVSPDINVKDKEIEIERQAKAKKQGSQYYDLITVEGKIKVKNYKDKEVKLNVKRQIFGELKNSDVVWKHARNVQYYSYSGTVNPANQVDWIVTMKAGEEKEITYTYTFYVYG